MRCSTPYGIKGSGTCNMAYSLAIEYSAQRLTASKVPALVPAILYAHIERVLNALRHQRFRHTRPYPGGSGRLRAQRLTASKVPALTPNHRGIDHLSCSTPYGIKGSGTISMARYFNPKISAQRLTASKVPAQVDHSALHALNAVLNALRHQRFRHVRGMFIPFS